MYQRFKDPGKGPGTLEGCLSEFPPPRVRRTLKRGDEDRGTELGKNGVPTLQGSRKGGGNA